MFSIFCGETLTTFKKALKYINNLGEIREIKMANLVDVLDFYDFGHEASYNISLALDIIKIKINATDSDSLPTTLIALNDALQKSFFSAGVERQQIQDSFTNQELRAQIVPLFRSFTDAINDGDNLPVKLLLGATEQGSKIRFDRLVELKQNNYSTNTVYLLGGARPLWIDQEPYATHFLTRELIVQKNMSNDEAQSYISEQVNNFFPNKTDINTKRIAFVNHFRIQNISYPTETDMLSYTANSYEELSDINFISVHAPMKIVGGKEQRPDTFDTFKQFLEDALPEIAQLAKNEPNGKFKISIISSGPYGPYQLQQAKSAFYGLPIEVFVSSSAVKDLNKINLSILFDTLAKTIYSGLNIVLEEMKRFEEETCNNKSHAICHE